jgi:hypothetical protein
MAKQVERYTNDESSSIRVEKAQQLLQSITYNIGLNLKSYPEMNTKLEVLQTEKLSVLFYQGLDLISEIYKKAKALLAQLQKNHLNIENYAYHDTLFTGIPEFFHDYNMEYAAHDNVGSIDYPLCKAITDLLGIEYQYEYLIRLTIENNFCRKFNDKTIQSLLDNFSNDSEQLLLNLFELVLTNAIGCELAGKNLEDLLLYPNDLEWLKNKLQPLSRSDIKNLLYSSLEHIAEELKIDEETYQYAKEAIAQLAVRVDQNRKTNTVDKIWITYKNVSTHEDTVFSQGETMEDEQLRILIDEMKECRYTKDKLVILRESIRSAVDMEEILEECFYGDELEEVFQLLNENELIYLVKEITGDASDMEDYDLYPLKDWQQRLLEYVKEKKI